MALRKSAGLVCTRRSHNACIAESDSGCAGLDFSLLTFRGLFLVELDFVSADLLVAHIAALHFGQLCTCNSDSAVDLRVFPIGTKLQCSIKTVDGIVVLALHDQAVAAIELGLGRGDPRERLLGLLELAGTEPGDSHAEWILKHFGSGLEFAPPHQPLTLLVGREPQPQPGKSTENGKRHDDFHDHVSPVVSGCSRRNVVSESNVINGTSHQPASAQRTPSPATPTATGAVAVRRTNERTSSRSGVMSWTSADNSVAARWIAVTSGVSARATAKK